MDVTPHELRTAEFREEWKGYRQRDVDTLLDRAAVTIEQLAIENRSLLERMHVLEHQRPDSDRGNDELIRKTLMMAQRAADEAVAEATDRARQLESDAAASSAATLESATTRARAALDEATARSSAVLADAEERSSTSIAAAEAHAAAVRAESDARAEALILDAEREARQRGGAIRSALEMECDALSARRHQLARDVEALDRFVVGHRDRLRAALHVEMAVIDSLPVLVMPAPPVEVTPTPAAAVTAPHIPPPPAITSIDPGTDGVALHPESADPPGDTAVVAPSTPDLLGHSSDGGVGEPGTEPEAQPEAEAGSIAEAELMSSMAASARLATASSAGGAEARGSLDLRSDAPSHAPSEPATAPVSLTDTPIAGALASDLRRSSAETVTADAGGAEVETDVEADVEAEPAPSLHDAGEAAIAPGFWLPSSRLIDDDDGPPTALLVTVDTAELQAIQAEQAHAEADASTFRHDEPMSGSHAVAADASGAPSGDRPFADARYDEVDEYEGDDHDDDQDDERAAEPVFIDLDTLGETGRRASSEQSDEQPEALGAWRSRGRPPAWRADDSSNREAVGDDDYLAELREAMNASDLPGPRDDDALFDEDFEAPRYGIFRRRR